MCWFVCSDCERGARESKAASLPVGTAVANELWWQDVVLHIEPTPQGVIATPNPPGNEDDDALASAIDVLWEAGLTVGVPDRSAAVSSRHSHAPY